MSPVRSSVTAAALLSVAACNTGHPPSQADRAERSDREISNALSPAALRNLRDNAGTGARAQAEGSGEGQPLAAPAPSEDEPGAAARRDAGDEEPPSASGGGLDAGGELPGTGVPR
jgi:hypothetical protein